MNPPVKTIYRLILRLYPASFRRRYEDEMLRAFADEWKRADSAGLAGRMRCLCHIAWDFLNSLPSEWLAETTASAGAAWLLVLAGALFASAQGTHEKWRILSCGLLTGAFGMRVLGLWRRHSWKIGLSFAAFGLPLAFALGPILRLEPPAPPSPAALAAANPPELDGPACI